MFLVKFVPSIYTSTYGTRRCAYRFNWGSSFCDHRLHKVCSIRLLVLCQEVVEIRHLARGGVIKTRTYLCDTIMRGRSCVMFVEILVGRVVPSTTPRACIARINRYDVLKYTYGLNVGILFEDCLYQKKVIAHYCCVLVASSAFLWFWALQKKTDSDLAICPVILARRSEEQVVTW